MIFLFVTRPIHLEWVKLRELRCLLLLGQTVFAVSFRAVTTNSIDNSRQGRCQCTAGGIRRRRWRSEFLEAQVFFV